MQKQFKEEEYPPKLVGFTPEQFGGSKTKGLELFQKALDQFNAYKAKSILDPNWGKGEAQYFLATKP